MAREWQTKIDGTAPADTGVLTADEHNSIGEEQEALVKSSGLTPVAYDAGTDTNQKQWAEAVARYASAGVFATDGGAADAYVLSGITITGASEAIRVPQAYFSPMRIIWVPANSNTGPSTVNAFTIGSTTIRTHADAALAGGEIVVGRPIVMRYDEAANSSAGAFLIEPWANALLFANAGASNIPLMPEVNETDNELVVSNLGGGTLEVNTSQVFIWRGWTQINTASFSAGERQFNTVANKTYHLRWHATGTGDAAPASTYPNGRFVLEDLSDAGYNPSTLAETDRAFDSTYDNMLIARVVTDGSNVPTITELANRNRLHTVETLSGAPTSNSGANGANWTKSFTLNWARTPDYQPTQQRHEITDPNPADSDMDISMTAENRYGATVFYKWDGATMLRLRVGADA